MPFWNPKPSLPIDLETQSWVDQRTLWLISQFGKPALFNATAILPTPEFFPDPYDATEPALRKMLDRICAYMHVSPARVELQLYKERKNPLVEKSTTSAGTYSAAGKEIISIETSRLQDPTVVVATMAHELAHARLLGEKRLTGDEEDHEPLTDLATVFFGLGIFSANSVFRFSQWAREGWSGWKAAKLGYLDEQTLSYALALWSYIRTEDSPRWAKHLTINPRAYVKQSLRYLTRTGNLTFPRGV